MRRYLLTPVLRSALRAAAAAAAAAALGACTGQVPSSFRFAQQDETYAVTEGFNTKIDLLWVVDNSASMDVSQKRLREGFTAFANKYMQPTWDIRVAVITTDAYLANPAFAAYLDTTIPGTVGYSTAYMTANKASWSPPAWNPALFDKVAGNFPAGIKYKEIVPAWGALGLQYSRLLPGIRDGAIAGLCTEHLPTKRFYGARTRCSVRDFSLAYSGVANCLTPGAGETSESQCVNTVQNDTVRSGKAIISTMPPSGTPANGAWTQGLINDFIVNVTVGSVGHGSTRGFSSLLQVLKDNEGTNTAFFRPGSIRGIIFISDTDDQSLIIPAVPGAGFTPFTDYACDQAQLIAANGAGPITGANGFCCDRADCSFGTQGTSCSSKTVEGNTFAQSVCPLQEKLVTTASVKTEIDAFFKTLDGSDSPNYFVTSIVATTWASIQSAQALHNADAVAVGDLTRVSADRGDRYMSLVDLVGSGSSSLDISQSDYSPILTAIGNTIIEKRATFTLKRPPTGQEDMIVQIVHENGSSTVVRPSQYSINGSTLRITDLDFALGLKSTDRININYQPRTAG